MEPPSPLRPVKLGIFFSHPTQHQSVMFQALSQRLELDVQVYYYDPGSLGRMLDKGYGNREAWDVDLLSGTRSTVLNNWLRGPATSVFRQCNPAIASIMRRERFDAVFVAGYISLSNWLVLAMARHTRAHVLYFSDTNILNEQRQPPNQLKRNIRQQFLDRVDTFLTIGDKNREVYIRLGYSTDKMTWCPYPVDVRRFEEARTDVQLPEKLAALRQQYEIPVGARSIAQCGKLILRKRPTDVIEAVRTLGRDDVYVLLIGSGPLETSIRSSLHEHDQVRITGFVNQSQMPYHMLLADIGVVASDWDPHPLVTTEFAACGKPIMVSPYLSLIHISVPTIPY